ncbi:dynamin family protein [Solibacillus sp. FSL H8-0538]|uniref:dynamin family protein n=1 Tax=Solibacillus sp. FSL H8-0538 TaxID=2921400 RepID=UPI0030F89D61
MQQKINQFIEIAEFLQDGVALDKIATLNEKLNEQQFYIPIIGQFSSGKSSLINNLMGRRILPTMLSETTAYTTFISYGESEYAEIVTNMVSYQFPIQNLMELSQRNLQTETSVSEILNVPRVLNSDILCINVYLNHPMLKTGIVFVDTPGLNTVISTHENRTMDILPKAHAILYVLGKALTAADVRLISSIDQMGIDLVFIRTKIDQLRRDENDTPAKIMFEDKEQLEQSIGRSATYFGVTNEEELLEFPHWRTLMDIIEQYFEQQFVQNIEKQRQSSIARRLEQVKMSFLTNLDERKKQLEVSRSVSDQDIQQKIKSLQQEIEYVDSRVKSKEKNFHLSFEATKEAILGNYEAQQYIVVQQYRQSLGEYTTIEALQKAAEVVAEKHITAATDTLKVDTNQMLNAFLQRAASETNEALHNEVEQFSLGDMPNVHLQVEVPTISDVFVQGEFIQEKIDSQVLYAEKLQEIEQKRLEFEGQAESIGEQMQLTQVEMQSLGNYEAKYIEKKNDNNQETMKKLGNLVDWALVFVPGKALSTGAVKLAGTVTKVAQGTKYVQQAAKVAAGIQKTGEVLSKVDKYKDLVKTFDASQKSIVRNPTMPNENVNLLNMLSLEYWFGQVGKAIDGPPQLVEDEQYRQAYLREKEAIQAKVEHTKQLELMRLQQLDMLNTREEKLREQMLLQEKYEQQMKQQLYEVERKHEQKMKEQQVTQYRQQLIASFELQMKQLFSSYRSNVATYLERFIQHMPAVISLNLQKQLHTQKTQLEELIETRQQNQEQQLVYEQQLFSHIHTLRS